MAKGVAHGRRKRKEGASTWPFTINGFYKKTGEREEGRDTGMD